MKQGLKKFFGAFRPLRLGMVLVLLAAFLAGYNFTASSIGTCQAQIPYVNPPPVLGGGCICCKGCWEPCVPPGTASSIRSMLVNSLYNSLDSSANTLELYIGESVDTLVEAILERLNQMELDIIAWWQTMWYYNLLPSLQNMTEQLNIAVVDQTRSFSGAIDAELQSQTSLEFNEREAQVQGKLAPSEDVCVAGTTAGGYGRATAFSREMRKAWQKESLDIGAGKTGTAGASGYAAVEKLRHDEYEALFCNPDDNGGNNNCAAPDADFHNADILPSKFLYDKLTIDVDDDPRFAQTVNAIMNNTMGTPSADAMPKKVMASAGGQEKWLDRRAFLARYAAVRSVPQMAFGWRMPGSQLGPWVKDLRQKAGVPLSDISDNPSYREVLHAASIDRFNSGEYALDQIAKRDKVEQEKLVLSAFYLMQLRDYYELLERQAMVLAVQVAIMADRTPLPDVLPVTPKN